ncbi:MAG: sugar phosphate isomerase/epimerase, partial [Gemmatimonadetes bacterium]|nr:sugar phosphate isomerase/epimerase [Gemmatimonadota bacterium]
WMIVELDRCETDMVEAVKKSYDYLVGEGLAAGNK